MRRKIMFASGLAALCLVGLAIWLYGRRTGQVAIVVPEASISTQTNGEPTPTVEAGRMDQRIFTLPVRYVMFAKDQISPCYFDRENKTLYRWKGVVLRADQLPPRSPYHYFPVFVAYDRSDVSPELIVKDYAVVLVEPPVRYRVSARVCLPGYWIGYSQVFYAWKGIALSKHELMDKSQDGEPASIGDIGQVIEIDMPDYLKYRPELWKKS